MPRYLTTQGSLFDPFSYEELARPIRNMAEIHRQTQDAYDTLSMETEALRNYITDNPDDSKAKAMYDNYISSLDTLQNNLWNNGYNAQTRRDLARARAGYASDITRIQKAITDRQERSKEYWDTWHQHPDQVRGADPGLSGLDNYLGNDLYGRDYYSYSGNQFSQDIAAEAKARRAEIMRDPKILTAGKVPGYITRLIERGFTNQEVDTAYQAVRAALFSGENGEIGLESLDPVITALDQLNDNSAILARVLVTNLESTGALGNLDRDQMARLLDYGRIGLSAAIGDPEIKDFDDLYFRQNLQLDTYRRQKDMDRAYAALDEPPVGSGYIMDRGYNRLVSSNAAKMSEFVGKKFTDAFTGDDGNPTTVYLKKLDGSVAHATDAASMGVQLYDTQGRRYMAASIPGFDVALPAFDSKYSQESAQVSDDGMFRTASLANINDDELKAQIRAAGYNRNSDAIVLQSVDGKWTFNEDATYNFNATKQAHEAEMQKIRELNKIDGNKDIDKYAMSPTELQQVKKKHGLEGVSDADVPVALRRMAVDELVIAPTIVGPTDEEDDKRERFARQIDNFYGSFSAQGLLGKSSQGIFYKITDGSGYSTAQEGESDIAAVFQLDNEGNIKPDCIRTIQLMPRDAGGEGLRIRLHIKNTDGSYTDWVMDAAALGENMGGILREMQSDLELATHPFRNAREGFTQSDTDSYNWGARIANSDLFREGVYGYMPIKDDGTLPTEKDILRDDNLYEQYQQAFIDRLQEKINEIIDGVTVNARAVPTNANRPKTSSISTPTYLIQE